MGRVRDYIEVENRNYWTLFDSGARNTYVTREVAKDLVGWDLPQRQPSALGGKTHQVSRMCALIARIQNHWVQTHARIVDEIGRDDRDKPIEVLFGALAMQEWGVELDLQNERVDMTHYPTEFVEF